MQVKMCGFGFSLEFTLLFDNDAALINYKDKAFSLYFVEDSTFALVIFFNNNLYSRIGSRIDFKTDFEECVIDKKKVP